MQGKNISILRDLAVCQSVSEALTKQGLTFEYRILNLEIKEANRFISRMLKISLGTPVLFLRKLRVIEDIPKSIESTYMVYEKVKGVEKEDLEHCSFYELIREKFGYVTQKSEEEILVVTPSPKEQELLQTKDQECLMIRGTSYVEERIPFEYFEIVAISDFYKFRSVSKQ